MEENNSVNIKHKVQDYWTSRVEKFSELKLEELNSDMAERWLIELEKYLPKGLKSTIKILDIGTGTGFLALLLARCGYNVIGIDLTKDMIKSANKTAKTLNIKADFCVDDAEKPDFATESFDVIVTRNLTWILPNLEKSYVNWYMILKKGGVIINFDGDYCRENVEYKNLEEHAHKVINDSQWDLYEKIKSDIREVSFDRPNWDSELLDKIGFRDIIIDNTLGDRIYLEKDKFFNPTPIFTIVASK